MNTTFFPKDKDSGFILSSYNDHIRMSLAREHHDMVYEVRKESIVLGSREMAVNVLTEMLRVLKEE